MRSQSHQRLGEDNMSIMDKLKKNSKVKETSILSKSILFAEKDITVTDVPMVNVALSGDIDGGLT